MGPTRRAQLLPARQRMLPTERVGELPVLLYVMAYMRVENRLSAYVLRRPSELRPRLARVAPGPCAWSRISLYFKRGAQGLERVDEEF